MEAPAPALARIKDRAVLEPLNNMDEWPMTDALQNFLNSIGLGYVTALNYPLRVDRCLVNILVTHYDVDQSCFIFNGIRFYFSLVDISIITGLRVDGKPVLGKLGSRDDMCQTAFGMTPPADAFEKGKIRFSWLRQEYSKLNVAEGDPLWLPYLRAFFLYFIGSFIIPDATTGVVSVRYLSLMEDMQAIGDYAWGAAAWATMHGCLQRHKINGLSYALMIFAIEHIRPLREELIGQVELPMKLPLISSWPSILHRVLNGDTTQKRGRYTAIVDNLVVAECIRHPYERLNLAEYGGQLAKACSETFCINFLDISPHTPNNYHTQFGFASIDPASAPGLPAVVVPIKNKGPTPKVDLAADVRFTAYKDAWLGRRPLRGELLDGWILQPWMDGWVPQEQEQVPQPQPDGEFFFSKMPPGFPPRRCSRMEAEESMDEDNPTLAEMFGCDIKFKNVETRTCGDSEKLSDQLQILASSPSETSVDTMKSETLIANDPMDEDQQTLSELFVNYKKHKNVEIRPCGDSVKLSGHVQNVAPSISECSVDTMKSDRFETEGIWNEGLIGGCKAETNQTHVMGSSARSSDSESARILLENRVAALKNRISKLESIVGVLKAYSPGNHL